MKSVHGAENSRSWRSDRIVHSPPSDTAANSKSRLLASTRRTPAPGPGAAQCFGAVFALDSSMG